MAIRCFETQYLTIVGAKGAGMNANGDVQFTEEDRGPGDMHEVGLQPLHVYSIVIPAYGLCVSRVLPASQPRITLFLAQAWSAEEGIGCPMCVFQRSRTPVSGRSRTAFQIDAGRCERRQVPVRILS